MTMKKTIAASLALLVLAGCGSKPTEGYVTTITDGTNIVVSEANFKISKQDIFNQLLKANGAAYVLDQALLALAKDADIPEEDIQAQVESLEAQYKMFMGEDLDAIASANLGYDTWAEYLEASLIPSIRQNLLITNYAKENAAMFATKYNAKQLSMITVDDEATAMSLINKISNGEVTFEEAFKENNVSSTTNPSIGVVTILDSCSADTSIKNILATLTINALYTVPVELSNGKYAVINVDASTPEEMGEALENYVVNAQEILGEVEAKFLTEANFNVLDSQLAEEIKAMNPAYLGE